jgi:hypothetical protein
MRPSSQASVSRKDSCASTVAPMYHLSLIFKWAREDDVRQAAEDARRVAVKKIEDQEAVSRKKIVSEQLFYWEALMGLYQRRIEFVERPRHFLFRVEEPSARKSVRNEERLAFIAIQNEMSRAFIKLIDDEKPLSCSAGKL